MLCDNGEGYTTRSGNRMIFELSKTRIGLESTVNEVSGEYEVIPRKKCKKCRRYLAKGTVSILCMTCSVKQIVS